MSTTRIVLIVSGAALAVVGVGVTAAGVAGMAFVGTDDTLNTSTHRLTTSANALVLPVDELDTRGADVLGRPTVHAGLRDAAAPVFIGVGPASAVDAYLAGTAVETVTDVDLDPYVLTTTFRTGTGRPAAPAAQTFWVAQGHGTTSADLAWKVRSGDYRVVVMNADAAPGLATGGRFGLTVPHLWGIAIAVTVVGVLAVGLGLALVLGAALSGRAGDTRERALAVQGG